MPIVDTAYRCVRCDAEYPTVGEAVACEKRDEWGLKLEDHAPRMYGILAGIFDDGGVPMVFSGQIADLLEDLGPPPPPRKE